MKHLTLTAVIIGSLVSAPAFAYMGRYPAQPRGYYYPAQQEPLNDFYISGDVGTGILATPDENMVDPDGTFITSASHSNSDVAAGASIGYKRRVNRTMSVGAEFGYDYNGQAKYDEGFGDGSSTTVKLTSKDFHLLATGTALFRNGFNVFGKAGVARVDESLRGSADLSNNNFVDLGDTSTTGYKPMVAAGLGYRFRMVDIYGQYSHIFATNADNFSDLADSNNNLAIVSVDTFKVGLSVHLNI